MKRPLQTLAVGKYFEAPRWRDGFLWLVDSLARTVSTIDGNGRLGTPALKPGALEDADRPRRSHPLRETRPAREPRREIVLPRRGGRRRLPGHRVRALLFVEPLRRSASRPELPREPLGRGGFAATREALDKDYPCVHERERLRVRHHGVACGALQYGALACSNPGAAQPSTAVSVAARVADGAALWHRCDRRPSESDRGPVPGSKAMTQQKLPGVSWESWIDQQIREARE